MTEIERLQLPQDIQLRVLATVGGAEELVVEYLTESPIVDENAEMYIVHAIIGDRVVHARYTVQRSGGEVSEFLEAYRISYIRTIEIRDDYRAKVDVDEPDGVATRHVPVKIARKLIRRGAPDG